MGFVEAVRTCLFRKYVDFRGRASRAEYWWFQVFLGLMGAPVSFAGGELVWFLLIGIIALPNLAVTVRRLHDTDRSGWWALLFLVGFSPWVVLQLASLVLVWFMVEKGDGFENRYGPNPAPDAVLGLSRLGRPASRRPPDQA